MREPDSILFIGFKGKNNLSGLLAEKLGPPYHLLTNSFDGLKRDIELIDTAYDCTVLLGVDRNLTGTVKIERTAKKNNVKCSSLLNLEKTAEAFEKAGVPAKISDTPTSWLCNEAYWHLLGKFNGRAVLIHIPTMKGADSLFIRNAIQALG